MTTPTTYLLRKLCISFSVVSGSRNLVNRLIETLTNLITIQLVFLIHTHAHTHTHTHTEILNCSSLESILSLSIKKEGTETYVNYQLVYISLNFIMSIVTAVSLYQEGLLIYYT